MTDIDEKLREILRGYGNHIVDNPFPHQDHVTSDEAIAQIKQAFADEGYIKDELAKATYTVHQPGYMTGQEWYDRFEKELEKVLLTGKSGIVQTENTPILEAARKSAGLSE